jgi:hypothetical protein
MVRAVFRWNRLYARYPAKRAFVKKRIQAHHSRFDLERRGVSIVDVRYVLSWMPLSRL